VVTQERREKTYRVPKNVVKSDWVPKNAVKPLL